MSSPHKEERISSWISQQLSGAKHKNVDPQNFNSKEGITDLVREWIWVQTKLSITLLGDKGVGKAFLANTLLEATFQDVSSTLRNHPSLDNEQFNITLASAHSDNAVIFTEPYVLC
jgi:predicted GTPase